MSPPVEILQVYCTLVVFKGHEVNTVVASSSRYWRTSIRFGSGRGTMSTFGFVAVPSPLIYSMLIAVDVCW